MCNKDLDSPKQIVFSEELKFILRTNACRVYGNGVKTMTISEAQNGFAKLLAIIGAGEEVELIQDQQPVAKVVPLKRAGKASLAGSVLEEGDLVSPIGIAWEAAS